MPRRYYLTKSKSRGIASSKGHAPNVWRSHGFNHKLGKKFDPPNSLWKHWSGSCSWTVPGACNTFLCRYLGLQKVHVQPLIEKIGNRLPRWKGRLLNRAGRLTLVQSLLSSMSTYHLIIFPLAIWARKQIDKIRRSFLWKGDDNANGGHCMVNWPTMSKPKDMGGLGVTDLDKFGKALRVRWLW